MNLLSLLVGMSAAQAGELSIPYEMYELDNGLTVILAEDHSVPVVQVNLWYHVGSKDEELGRTGFAHLFEHMMFQGSENNNQDYFEPLQEIGARVNGSTNLDRTNYFEEVPAEHLPLALWAEADRMGWLVIDQGRLDNQREVVRNERRQRYDNRPYGTVWLTLLSNLHPEGHPYHHSTIGSHEDLAAATLDDVQGFFDTWYVPNNASLVIAGDFEPAQAKELVQQYFGEIPRGPDAEPAKADMPVLTEEKVIRQEEAGVPYAKMWVAWPSPALYAPGDAELDLMSSLLADGKESRLYSHLVLDKQMAKEVEAYQASSILSSMYIIEATPAPGYTTDQVLAEIDAVVAGFLEEGPTEDELAVGRTQYEVRFINGLATVGRKADRLNSYYVNTGEPDYLQQDLDRYLNATVEGVKAAAQETLGSPGRIVLHITPPSDTEEK